MFKAMGYLVSSISVILLGVTSWNSAKDKPLILTCLIAGMALSVCGMALRWHSHQRDKADMTRLQAQIDAARHHKPD
jgi:hypothetical protein